MQEATYKAMRIFHQLVFDGYVNGTADVFSDNQFDALLGSADQLSLSGYTAQVGGTNPTLTVQVQQSFDQRRWLNRNTVAEVTMSTTAPLSTTTETNFQGQDGDPTARPALGFARVRLALAATAGTPSGQVRVWVTGRDRSES